MKFKYCLAIACLAMAICSCDEGTDNVGMSLTSSNDNINVTAQEYDVMTASYIPDSVYAYSNELYLGRVTDPETNTTVNCSFMLQFNMMDQISLPSDEEILYSDDNVVEADSCLLYLYFDKSKTFGDSLTAMKLRISELDHPVADGVHYTNFDPVKEGYIRKGGLSESSMYTYTDLTLKDSIRALSSHEPHVTIRLNKPYTDKNGVTYNNYGTYILNNYYKHPEYFKNSFAFIHQLCPGFYIETTDGTGLMSHFFMARLGVYYNYISEDDNALYAAYFSAASTQEVLQTVSVKNDKAALKKLIDSDSECTYLKSPAAVFTEVTFPIDEIKSAHMNDSLLSVSISFNRINNIEPLTKFTFEAPKKVMLIQKDSLNSFFEKNQNYNNKYAFYSTLSKNAYSFSSSNDINNLIVKMYNDRLEGLKHDPNWVENHPNWNKALLMPIDEITTTTTSYSTTTSTPIALIHQMGLTSTRMKRGTPASPIKLRVIYAKFNK